MKNSNLYILLAFATLLAACSSNQDLASLDEYDDVYYQGGSELSAELSTPSSQTELDGASNAERSYYENVPYMEEEVVEEEVNSDSDYYDEDYSSRIENFNGTNQGQYLYSDPTYNSSPSVNWNVGYGMGSYGSGLNMGFSYGSPGYIGYPYYSSYSMFSPWNSPWYRPYPMYSWNRPYYDPFYPYGGGYCGFYGGGSYYGGGYYGGGGGYPPYYGSDYSGSNGITSTPRQGSSSVRPSRGGVITQGGSAGSGRNELSKQSGTRRSVSGTERPLESRKSGSANEAGLSESRRTVSSDRSQDVELRNRNVQTSENSREYYNSQDARDYTRPGTSRTENVRSQQPDGTRSSNSPIRTYTPQRSTQRDAIAPANRSRNTAQPSSPTYSRQRSTGTSTPTRTRPSRSSNSSRSSSPSASPSPSRSVSPSRSSGSSGGSNSKSSSPSRGSRR